MATSGLEHPAVLGSLGADSREYEAVRAQKSLSPLGQALRAFMWSLDASEPTVIERAEAVEKAIRDLVEERITARGV